MLHWCCTHCGVILCTSNIICWHKYSTFRLYCAHRKILFL
jgi:hypothetical protein